MKRILVFIPLVILAACSSDKKNNNDSSDKKNITPQYQFATVQKGGISTTVKLPAQLAAYEEVSIFPKVNGYVKDVKVDIGSHVRQGELLMTLDAPELLRYRSNLLHDGRATDIPTAILNHSGQAGPSAVAFAFLPLASQVALVAFVKSL